MSRIIVAGGGYAGLRVASTLASRLERSWSIELIDARLQHELLTRLPEVASGDLAARYARISYAEILPSRVRFRHGSILGVDPSARSVHLHDGALEADFLVLAFGAVTDFLQVPGARERSVTLRSVDEAERVSAALLAGRQTGWRLRVLIVGAGYTGTEMAGELSSKDRQEVYEVQLLAEDARLLPQGNERLAYAADKRLRARGVQVTLGCKVERVERDGVIVDGTHIPSDLVVWAARSIPNWPVSDGFRHGPDRRIEVDDSLRALGFSRVFVIGDSANARDCATGVPVAANAQLALQEADVAAANILAEIDGTRSTPFRPRILGEALSLGPDDGIAEVAGAVVTGRAALAVKRAALGRYLYGLGGARLVRKYLRA